MPLPKTYIYTCTVCRKPHSQSEPKPLLICCNIVCKLRGIQVGGKVA